MAGLEVRCQTVGSPPGRFLPNLTGRDGPWGRELAAADNGRRMGYSKKGARYMM